jgi:hypothetical protein
LGTGHDISLILKQSIYFSDSRPASAASAAAPEGGHRNDLDDTEAPVLQSPVKQVTPAGLVDAAAERV